MKVLMITGDRSFTPGHPRYELQRSAVEEFAVMYWGRGSLFPRIPKGSWDVVTVQDPFWRGLFARHVARRLGARLNVQVHTDLAAQGFFRRMLAQFVLRRAASVRVVSEKIKKQVERMGVRTPATVLTIFVDVEKFTHLPRAPHAQKTILWLGRFEAEKDPLQAIAVLQAVRAGGTDARLVMLGAGSLEQALHRKAERLPVEFPGWRDPTTYLPEADVVLSTSLHESFGASMVEALAAGVPVVAPDVGVAREAGAIVVPRDELAAKTEEVLRIGSRGTLQLSLLAKEEWIRRWRESLL